MVQTDFLTAADLTVDCEKHMVRRDGNEIFLTAKEYALLELLLRCKGRVLSREEIQQQLWDEDYDGSSNIVAVYINYLREKIDSGFRVKLIHTVRGSGYVLREDES